MDNSYDKKLVSPYDLGHDDAEEATLDKRLMVTMTPQGIAKISPEVIFHSTTMIKTKATVS